MLPAFEPIPPADARDKLFDEAAARFAAPLARLAHALEDEPAGREALTQDIHVALWRSLAAFDGRVPMRIWVFRVAHHAVFSHRPNTQDQDPASTPVSKLWAQRRARREVR